MSKSYRNQPTMARTARVKRRKVLDTLREREYDGSQSGTPNTQSGDEQDLR